VLAIELLAAAHAIDCMRPLRSTPVLERVHETVRGQVPFNPKDHRLDRDIAALTRLVAGGTLRQFLG
jgi:histidine ammonia-lyase